MIARRLSIALAAAVLATATLGGCPAGGGHDGRTIVLAIDGLDPGVLDLLMSEGKLPGFARLRQQGAYGRLISSKPLLSPIIWTTIATGREPADHGIGHFTTVNEVTGEHLPATSQMRRVKALWNIESDAGRDVAVVGWWATWPAETVHGHIVSDHTCYHFLFDEGMDGPDGETGLTHPPGLHDTIAPMIRRPGDLEAADIAPFVRVSQEEFDRPFAFEDPLGHFRWALATAESHADIGLHLWNTARPDLLMVYIEGVDSTSHLFGHLFRASGLQGELAEQHRKFGDTVEQMYLYADRLVSRYLEVMDRDTTLVVLSDHGFELGALHDDPTKTRDMRRVSERFHRIEGVLYLHGNGVREAVRIDRPRLVDVAPTLLALAGLPAASDMPGRVLAEALDFPEPGPRVATYERDGAPGAADAAASAPVDSAVLEHLRSLGYLDTQSPTGDRNLAALHFQAGRHREAADIYRRLVAEEPGNASLRASLAGTLAAMGDYTAALEQLDESEKLEPLHPETYHNRGAIFERQGRREEAIAQYEAAVRYAPKYAPSRRALERLTGSADVDPPETDAERRAYELAQAAGQAARRSDYATASRLLDEAEQVAPDYAIVHQYRSNVAFLSGDTAAAVRALERALELEPDNALFRTNLERLRSAPAN